MSNERREKDKERIRIMQRVDEEEQALLTKVKEVLEEHYNTYMSIDSIEDVIAAYNDVVRG